MPNGSGNDLNGGGLFNSANKLTLRNLTLHGNTAHLGAGMYTSSIPNLDKLTFTNNAANFGGGMNIDVRFSNNFQISRLAFVGNRAEVQGGGLYIWNDAAPRLVNSVFVKNVAGTGGGIYTSSDLKSMYKAGGSRFANMLFVACNYVQTGFLTGSPSNILITAGDPFVNINQPVGADGV